MEQINATQRPAYLEDYVDMKIIRAYGTNTLVNVFVNSGSSSDRSDDDTRFMLDASIESVLKSLRTIPHSQTYRREAIPDRYHYRTNERIGDLVIVLEPGYELHRSSSRRITRVSLLRLVVLR